MSQRNPSYESLYGVGLLDDLHNYFPALLYEGDSFRSVRDVLHYVASQTRRRFDLYSFGLHAYESANDSVEESSSAAVNVPIETRNENQFYQYIGRPAGRVSSASPAPPAQPPASSSPAAQNTRESSPNARPYRYVVDLGEHLLSENTPSVMSPTLLTTLLAGLHPNAIESPPIRTSRLFTERSQGLNSLSALASLLLGTEGTLMNNLEPVIVRPTSEQIQRATLLGNPESEQDCAVCQDSITNEQQGRKILHCGHWFHKDCIDPWFQQNVQCPVCRHDIRETTREETTENQQFPTE